MGYHVLWREGLANIVKKTACPACGSHDNLVVYSDGGMHCFGIDCGYTVLGEEYKLEHGILDQVYEHEEGNKLMFQEKWERIKSKTVTEGGGFRGIRDDIYAKFGVRHEYHKVLQNGEETDELVAQYYPLTTTEGDDTQVCGVKVRSIPKKFHAEGTNKKDKTHLFGQVNFLNSLSKTVVLTSGECFPPEVEVFTDQGFKRFDALDKTELVLQVTEEGTEFVKPLAYVDKPYKGDLVHLSYSKFEVLCTPDHNLVYSKNGLVKIKAKDTPPGSAVFLSSVKATNPRLDRSDAEIVYHTLDYLCDLSTASHDTLVDVQDVLDSLGVKTHMETIMGKGSTLEVEDMGAPISPHLLSMAQREMVIEYVRNVSGASPRRLQELLCLSGESSVIINGKLFKALNNKASHTHTREMVSYEGRVYCVTVPSGMIMIRHNGKVGVVGNCDLLASYQMLFDALGNDQCPAVVSGTCGEGAVEQYSAQYDFLNRFEKIIIVPDADEAGRKALKRAVQTLPKDKVYVLDVPTVYKDPNAMLMAGKAKDFVTLYFRAKPYVPDGIVGSGQLFESMKETNKLEKIPLPPFMHELEEMLNGGFTLESIVNIVAASGLGGIPFINKGFEQWRRIQTFDSYLVSNFGRVFSEISHKFLKPDSIPTGHRRVILSKNGETKRFSVHRLVATYFIPNYYDKPCVNHTDNNPGNNHVSNLEWCTHSENMIHAQKQGRLFKSQGKGGKVHHNCSVEKHLQAVGKVFGCIEVKSLTDQVASNGKKLLEVECLRCGNRSLKVLNYLETRKPKRCSNCKPK